jgi:hypothetical protein
MVTVIDTERVSLEEVSTTAPRAALLGPEERKRLAVEMLSGTWRVTELAGENGVSRKFLYQQAAKAEEALAQAFAPPPAEDEILFHLPVTREWLCQLVVTSVLVCHSSFRGVQELLEALFDYREMSLGTIHNIVGDAIKAARVVNGAEELSRVRFGAHDEIFQARLPVLVGMDIQSTYCYLLVADHHRDETTWGAHLLELTKAGLRPDFTVADFGTGLRAGQRAAWGDLPCHGDVFHAELEFGRLTVFLENRAYGTISARESLERKMTRAKNKNRGHKLSKQLALARKAEADAIGLADDIRLLCAWMKDDVLATAGPCWEQRCALYAFVIDELRQRESRCPHRIGPVLRLLSNQRDALLAFVRVQDERFAELATRLGIDPRWIHQMVQLQALSRHTDAYWRDHQRLIAELRGRFHQVETEIRQILQEIPRASSIVENLNSRLRSYFHLRRHVGSDYLEILRFFLNHRVFMRSDRPERVGKSPKELLTGQAHAHWLELLGYRRFKRA